LSGGARVGTRKRSGTKGSFTSAPADEPPLASRAGLKLAAALDGFGVDPKGFVCADFGSHAGGFVDVLLRRGAAKVYAVEKGYGVLAYRLRRDLRVVVMERVNAIHVELPEPVDLVTVDVGWTRQKHILPAARRALNDTGTVISLLKPHYEAPAHLLSHGVLPADQIQTVVAAVLQEIQALRFQILGQMDSPIAGHAGNREVLIWLRPL